MKQIKKAFIIQVPKDCGFSLVELVIAVAIILVISAFAIPSLTKTVRGYQLHDAASQLAGILKFTRFEAIRRNVPTTCVNTQGVASGQASVWSDNNNDGVAQTTERQILLGSSATLQAAAPDAGALATAVGAGALTAVNPAAGNLTFDQRGAVVPPAIYVYYVGNTAADGGFRAVIVLPSGSVQVWTHTGGGTPWQRLS